MVSIHAFGKDVEIEINFCPCGYGEGGYGEGRHYGLSGSLLFCFCAYFLFDTLLRGGMFFAEGECPLPLEDGFMVSSQFPQHIA